MCIRTSQASCSCKQAAPEQPIRVPALDEWHSPFFVLKDEFPQLQIPQHQPPIVAVGHGRGDLVEQSGRLLLPQLLAGADKRMHVPIASLKEHIGFGLSQDDFGDLVDVAVGRQAKARGQGFLVAAYIEHLGQDSQQDQESGAPRKPPNHRMARAFEETEGGRNLGHRPHWPCLLPAV